jgi:Ca2+-binding EF-hand superfamily protein
MYPDEIQQKFRDWDFEAEFGMGYSEYRAEFRDGNITENELKQAMKFYGLKNYEIETDIRNLKDEIRFKNKFGMTMTEMQDSYDRGDVSRNTMIDAKMFTGMTKTEAQKWITQRDISNQMGIDYAELDDAYKYGDISRNDLRNAILKNGETVQNTDEAMMGYDWLKKNIKKYPDLGISDAKKFAVRIHSDYAPDETLEDYGVSVEAYTEYQKLRPECKGVDANGDGKVDSGTLRDSVFRMIDSLPISSEAKDGLALMSYSATSIRRNAPWH